MTIRQEIAALLDMLKRLQPHTCVLVTKLRLEKPGVKDPSQTYVLEGEHPLRTLPAGIDRPSKNTVSCLIIHPLGPPESTLEPDPDWHPSRARLIFCLDKWISLVTRNKFEGYDYDGRLIEGMQFAENAEHALAIWAYVNQMEFDSNALDHMTGKLVEASGDDGDGD